MRKVLTGSQAIRQANLKAGFGVAAVGGKPAASLEPKEVADLIRVSPRPMEIVFRYSSRHYYIVENAIATGLAPRSFTVISSAGKKSWRATTCAVVLDSRYHFLEASNQIYRPVGG